MQKMRYTVQSILLTAILLFAITVSQAQANDLSATLTIESIGVETAIVEAPLLPDYSSWNVSHLSMNVGHLVGTSWFGSGSNIVIGGHSETPTFTPDVFYNLDAVQINDIITVNTNGTQYQYIVTEVRSVSIFDVRIAYPTPYEQLVLITCQRDSYNNNTGQYQNRVVIVAVPL